MKKQKLNLKALVLSLGLGAAMLCAPSAQAQGVFGDLLDNYYEEQEASRGALLGKSGGGESEGGFSIGTNGFNNGSTGGFQIGTHGFGDGNNGPLGSGLFIMAAAGAGYALKKRKNNK